MQFSYIEQPSPDDYEPSHELSEKGLRRLEEDAKWLYDGDASNLSASAWQARQPVHTRSVNRWSHYYDQAPEFFDRLSAIDSEHDVENH